MVIELAKPYDEEEAKRMLQRAQYVPRPQAVQQQKDPMREGERIFERNML